MKKFTSLPVLACASLALLQTPSEGVVGDTPNSNLTTKANHGAAQTPKGWKAIGGKQGVKVWDRGEELGKVVALSADSTIETSLKLAEISESEKKVKGEWKGILLVDLIGAYGGRGTCDIELVVEDEVIFEKSVRAKNKAEQGKEKLQREWIDLPKEALDALIGATAKIRITAKGKQSTVVISGIDVIRVHEAPTKRLEAKPNGKSGPDRVAAGCLGFNALVEHKQKVFTIHGLTKGGNGEKGGLKIGDVVVSVNGEILKRHNGNPGLDWYSNSHERSLGEAVLAAPKKGNYVTLGVLREGKVRDIRVRCPKVQLPVNFFESKEGEKYQEDMIGFLDKNQKKDGSVGGPIRTTFAVLSWLSEKDPKHTEKIFRAVNWMLKKYPNAENFGNLGFWHSSYAGIMYCEYYLATGDKRVIPRIQAIHDWVMTGFHSSTWGMACLGHGPTGLPYSNKALMAPTSHLLVFEELAKRCGLETQIWDTALPYVDYCWSDPAKGGHGSMGYNASYKDKAQFWSRSGQTALACALGKKRGDMLKGVTSFMADNYSFYRNSHAYGEPGGAWGIISLAYASPESYKKVMNAYRWSFALNWEPGVGMRFSMPHMGAPYMGEEDLVNACYALAFNASKKTLHMTGGEATNWLDMSKMDIPVSEVLIRQERTGEIWMETRIAGGKIYYTTNGRAPNKESKLFTEPFMLKAGQKVRAIHIPKSGRGEIAEFEAGSQVGVLKVIQASGDKDEKNAIKRAQHSADNAMFYQWIPDRGQDAKGYPHHVVYDLGEERDISSLRFWHVGGGVAKCRVQSALTLTEEPTLLAEVEWDKFEKVNKVNFSKTQKARYVRVEFLEPVDTEKASFALKELKIE